MHTYSKQASKQIINQPINPPIHQQQSTPHIRKKSNKPKPTQPGTEGLTWHSNTRGPCTHAK